MQTVLFIPKWFPSSNRPDYGLFVYKHAQAAAIHYKVIVLYIHPDIKESVIKEGNLTIYYIPLPKSIIPSSIVKYFLYLKHVSKILKTEPIHLCHSHVFPGPVIIAYIAKLRWKIPYVVTEHWSGYCTGQFNKEHILRKTITKFLSKKAAFILPVSEFLKTHMISCGIQGNYKVIPNIVDIPIKDNKTIKGVYQFIMIADLEDRIKNISGVIKAMLQFKNSDTIQLKIVGGGKDDAKLKSLVNELGLDKHISFSGALPHHQVAEALSSSNCLIVNSNIETFGIVVIEALMMNVHVISTSCGGPEEIITKIKSGKIIPKSNENALSTAMKEALTNKNFDQNPEIVKRLNSNYGKLHIANSLNECYQKAINKEFYFEI